MTLRACPRPLSLPRLGALPSCTVTQLRLGLEFGSPPTSPGPAPFRGVQPPPGTPLPGGVALARRLPVSEPQFPLSHDVSAHPRGCGKPSSTAPSAWQCRGAARSPFLEVGSNRRPIFCPVTLGKGGPPLWASVAHLRK